MRFSTHQTFVLGAALVALPAIAAPAPNPNNDARSSDLGSIEGRGFLTGIEHGIEGFENLKSNFKAAEKGPLGATGPTMQAPPMGYKP